MATGHTLTPHQGRQMLDPNKLNVRGRGLSPGGTIDGQHGKEEKALSSNSSVRTAYSDEDEDDEDELSHRSEEYTVLDGVRDMNHILVKQIETLRLKIQVDEKNYNVAKERLQEESNSKLKSKETEIDDLRDSINNRDDRIQALEKASHEKDKQIKSKCEEIESLKDIVKQTEDYAKRLQRQAGRSKSQSGPVEEDPLYKKQSEEMAKLTEELGLLRTRLAQMEQELQLAMNVIEQQNEKMKSMTEEKGLMHAKFKEDLDKATKSMRQEVERMREVMRQNWEEMKTIREQNKKMSDDVRDIKELLQKRVGNAEVDHDDDDDDHDLPYTRQTFGQRHAVPTRGNPGMVGGNIKQSSSFRSQQAQLQQTYAPQNKRQYTILRENSHMTTGRSYRNSNDPIRASVTSNPLSARGRPPNSPGPPESSRSNNNMSPDRISRPVGGAHNTASSRTTALGRPTNKQGTLHPNVPEHNAREVTKSFPPICSFKDAPGTVSNRQPSARGGRLVRRGSAARK